MGFGPDQVFVAGQDRREIGCKFQREFTFQRREMIGCKFQTEKREKKM